MPKFFGVKVSLSPALLVLIALVALAVSMKFLKEGFESEGKTLVLYFAPWCGHCKALKPEWEKLEKTGIKGVTIRKVNADEEKEEAKEAGVEGYPTIIFYNNGEKKVYSGARTADEISKWVAAL
jgi:protein disulfide-isomerase-like protein